MKYSCVLVTGGAGFVGSILSPKLLSITDRVKVFDLFTYGPVGEIENNPRIENIKSDIRSKKHLEKSLVGVDAVIHLAGLAYDYGQEVDEKLAKEIDFDATVQLVDLAKKAGVKRFVFASSSAVYGVKKEKKVTEDLPLNPVSPYVRYKIESEKYVLTHSDDDFCTIVVRPAAICGYSPRLRLDVSVNILTLKALVDRKITVNGGKQSRAQIHIEDLTDFYTKLLSYPTEKVCGEVFNMNSENYAILELAQLVKETLADKYIQIEVNPSGDNRSYHLNSDKAKRVLGFTPKRTVADAVRDLARAYKAGKIHNPFSAAGYYNSKTVRKIR